MPEEGQPVGIFLQTLARGGGVSNKKITITCRVGMTKQKPVRAKIALEQRTKWQKKAQW